MSDQHALYIDGEWINTEASVANISPSDSHDVIGHYAQASIEHVDQAIEAANRAVADWGVSGLETRYQVLMAIGNELIERSAELGELLAREEGKTKAEGTGEVYRSGQFFHRRPCGIGAARYRNRDPARTCGRCCSHQPLEFPNGDGGLENCPRPRFW